MPEPEDQLLDALSRLHAAGQDVIVPDARLVGMFRAHGLLAPVWDLPVGTGAEVLEEPAAKFRGDARRGAGRLLRPHHRAARRPLRAGEPSGHYSLDRSDHACRRE